MKILFKNNIIPNISSKYLQDPNRPTNRVVGTSKQGEGRKKKNAGCFSKSAQVYFVSYVWFYTYFLL